MMAHRSTLGLSSPRNAFRLPLLCRAGACIWKKCGEKNVLFSRKLSRLVWCENQNGALFRGIFLWLDAFEKCQITGVYCERSRKPTIPGNRLRKAGEIAGTTGKTLDRDSNLELDVYPAIFLLSPSRSSVGCVTSGKLFEVSIALSQLLIALKSPLSMMIKN